MGCCRGGALGAPGGIAPGRAPSILRPMRGPPPAAGVRCGRAAERVAGHQQHHHVLRPDRWGVLLGWPARRSWRSGGTGPALDPRPLPPARHCPGAGKTFTMTGGRQSYSQRGLVPRVLSQLFQDLRARADRITTVQVGGGRGSRGAQAAQPATIARGSERRQRPDAVYRQCRHGRDTYPQAAAPPAAPPAPLPAGVLPGDLQRAAVRPAAADHPAAGDLRPRGRQGAGAAAGPAGGGGGQRGAGAPAALRGRQRQQQHPPRGDGQQAPQAE